MPNVLYIALALGCKPSDRLLDVMSQQFGAPEGASIRIPAQISASNFSGGLAGC